MSFKCSEVNYSAESKKEAVINYVSHEICLRTRLRTHSLKENRD